ncbi:hypothetical protein AB6A40_008420 [Gnathostoma spinigerum]|uniref:ZP domain-containing protein n=1 Tax=Gnathostoma spinigerum TaxID=75299 RepID=A0ABD6EPF0_9BILA
MDRVRSLNPRGIFVETTVVISFHPLFLTKIDRAYRVRCFYMEADKTVSSQLVVSDLTTAFATQLVAMPSCRYEILGGGPSGRPVEYAQVGEQVYHKWTCETESVGSFCAVVHSCYVDDGRGETVQILDDDGCAIDKYVLNNLEYPTDLMAGQEAHVYKFADRSQLSYHCQISISSKSPDVECQRPLCSEPVGYVTSTSQNQIPSKPAVALKQTTSQIPLEESLIIQTDHSSLQPHTPHVSSTIILSTIAGPTTSAEPSTSSTPSTTSFHLSSTSDSITSSQPSSSSGESALQISPSSPTTLAANDTSPLFHSSETTHEPLPSNSTPVALLSNNEDDVDSFAAIGELQSTSPSTPSSAVESSTSKASIVDRLPSVSSDLQTDRSVENDTTATPDPLFEVEFALSTENEVNQKLSPVTSNEVSAEILPRSVTSRIHREPATLLTDIQEQNALPSQSIDQSLIEGRLLRRKRHLIERDNTMDVRTQLSAFDNADETLDGIHSLHSHSLQDAFLKADLRDVFCMSRLIVTTFFSFILFYTMTMLIVIGFKLFRPEFDSLE